MAMPTGFHRFNDYLTCLQDEFELQTSSSSESLGARRFNIYLGNIKGEFELMTLEIQSLQNEADEYKAKIEFLAEQLQNVRRDIVCERCNRETASVPQIFVSSEPTSAATTPPPLPKPSFQHKTRAKPRTPRNVDLTQETSAHRSTRPTTPVKRPRTGVSPSSSQTVSLPTPQSSDVVAHPQTITSSPSLRPAPTPTDTVPDSGPELGPEAEDHGWSLTYNDQVPKEFNIKLERAISHQMTITCVRFTQDGKSLAAGCDDGMAYIYDVETGALIRVFKNLLTKHARVIALCFSFDGKYLATSTSDADIYIWDVNTKFVRFAFRNHTMFVFALEFSPKGRHLVTASYDNTVRLWNLRDGHGRVLVEKYPAFLDIPYYSSAAFSPDGRYVAASHRDGMVRIWDVRANRLMRRVDAHIWVSDVKYMPDGKALVSGSREKTLKVWDVSSLGRTRMANDPRPRVEFQRRPEKEFLSHDDAVRSIAPSPDGRWIASGSFDKSIRFWDPRTAAMQCVLHNVHEAVWWVDFCPTGRYMASGGEGGLVRIWRYWYTRPGRR